MRKFIIAFCVLSFWLGAIGETAVQTFSATGEYTMSDLETPENAEQRAIAYARQRAAEQAGVYVASYTRTEGMSVAEDEVKALASKSLEIIEQKTYKEAQPNGDIHIKAEIVTKVDTSDIDRIIKAQGAERERKREALTQSYRDMQEATAAFEKKNEVLRQKITEAKASNQDLSALKEETKSQEREFLSMQKVEEADSFWLRGKLDAMMALCDEALRLNPKNYFAYNERGLAYNAIGDDKQAITDFSRALELNSSYAFALNNRGALYCINGDYDRAIADFDHALELNPQYVYAFNGRGNTYVCKNEPDKAIADYDCALKLDPQFSNAYSGRGNAYCDKGDYERAMRDYNQALECDSRNQYAYKGRGAIYGAKGHYENAVADFSCALNIDASDDESYFKRGKAYVGMKDYNRAIEDFSCALKINPNFVEAYGMRGGLYGMQGKYEKALSDFESALRIDPTYQPAKKLRQALLDAMRRR